jgi:pimeloyl-ACP methyl ester carboxylesterase
MLFSRHCKSASDKELPLFASPVPSDEGHEVSLARLAMLLLFSLPGIAGLILVLWSFASVQSLPDGQVGPGCRMSWMYPSYYRIPLDSSHSTLSGKYSLYLYREQGWDLATQPRGFPVLFVPGNAGSFRQVRSLASAASHEFYLSPSVTRQHYLKAGKRPLDFFAVDFNEDFSAFHGDTIRQQARFILDSIRHIQSLYPSPHMDHKAAIIGHSMGGISARLALLDMGDENLVDTLITLSTPHLSPPAPFDPIIESVYSQINSPSLSLPEDFAIVSISGGEKDSMVSADSTPLPRHLAPSGWSTYTTSVPQLWSEVDHQAMLWCDQLRLAIVKGLLEGQGESAETRRGALRNHLLGGFPDERGDSTRALRLVEAEVLAAVSTGPWLDVDGGDVRLIKVEQDKTFVYLGRGEPKIWLCDTVHECAEAENVHDRTALLPGSRDGVEAWKTFTVGAEEVQGKQYVGISGQGSTMLVAGFQEMASPSFKLDLFCENFVGVFVCNCFFLGRLNPEVFHSGTVQTAHDRIAV